MTLHSFSIFYSLLSILLLICPKLQALILFEMRVQRLLSFLSLICLVLIRSIRGGFLFYFMIFNSIFIGIGYIIIPIYYINFVFILYSFISSPVIWSAIYFIGIISPPFNFASVNANIFYYRN